MHRSRDEIPIREMFDCLKRADEQRAPDFDDILARPARPSSGRRVPRLRLLLVGCTAVVLLGAFLYERSQRDGRPDAIGPPVAEKDEATESAGPSPAHIPQHQRIARIDFDYLRRIVDEHTDRTPSMGGAGTSVWSSRTDSLLTCNLHESFDGNER